MEREKPRLPGPAERKGKARRMEGRFTTELSGMAVLYFKGFKGRSVGGKASPQFVSSQVSSNTHWRRALLIEGAAR
jgi:hypothetical protein